MQIHLHTPGLIALSAWASPAEEEKGEMLALDLFAVPASPHKENVHTLNISQYKIYHAAFSPEANLEEHTTDLLST